MCVLSARGASFLFAFACPPVASPSPTLAVPPSQAACAKAGVPLKLRMQEGYDHSYFFIASFIEDHVRFHAMYLSS